ncbi:hypothetical protein [Arthrobacter roseus]|uniref:hypothetical protein n=1 Tax=Arthrobacter roseus TaxID=136274 RepID=UPI00196294CE|nr:hypothetical protein [Arthrobacter roseus]MBM7848726.1 hypothetical protein [Arthrobacter roseus]
MNTVRPLPAVPPNKGHQLFTFDLSSVSSSRLTTLSDKLYKELDTVAPDARARDRDDDLIEEIGLRNGPSTDRVDDVQSSA